MVLKSKINIKKELSPNTTKVFYIT